jgi:hypothetical protein
MAGRAPSVTRTGNIDTFAYTPPSRIYRAVRVLLTLAADADPQTFAAALRGIWRFTPLTRALVTEHPELEDWMLGANMAAVDLDSLPMRPYVATGGTTSRPLTASHMFADCDGSITLATVRPETLDAPPSLAVMAEYAQGSDDLGEIYRAMSPYFVGAIVRVGDKVVWGDDILDVDANAYRLAGKPVHPLIRELRS